MDMNNKALTLAIISPCYNEESLVHQSCHALLKLLKNLIENNLIAENSYITIVDDGSIDNTWNELCEVAVEEKKIKLVRLACNFGQQQAILAGYETSQADIYVTLDFDLQDDVSVISQMIEKYKNNDIDIVYGVRKSRKSDSLYKSITANLYYKFASLLGVKEIPNAPDFRLVSPKVVSCLKRIKERNIYLKGFLYQQGFKYDMVFYHRKKREKGSTKYSFFKLFDLAIEGITTGSARPVRFILFFAFICFVRFLTCFNDIYIVGCLVLFSIWIVGEYAQKALIESKNRPNYVIADKINHD